MPEIKYINPGNIQEFITLVTNLKSDKTLSYIQIEEILDGEGWRSSNGKKLSKSSYNHILLREKEKITHFGMKTTPINEDDSSVEIIEEHKQAVNEIIKGGKEPMIKPGQFNLSPDWDKEQENIKPEVNLIEKDFNARIDLIVQLARSMNINWKKCLEYKSGIKMLVNDEIDQKEEFINFKSDGFPVPGKISGDKTTN